MTEKLFYRDSHLSEFEAVVTECRKQDDHYEIELDKTAFFPEGGGQYADTGYLNHVRVSDVQERGDAICHITDMPVAPGTEVTGKIDWEERFMKMQQHSGEHIVSGLVHSEYGYDNVGFHLGSEDCTMDFNGELTRLQLREIERKANAAVWKNLKIRSLYPTKEELAGMEYRSKIEIEGQVRIIEIPGYDVCACCAPHVDYTGEIGLIKLTHVQRYKGGVRVTMLCGSRALEDYETKQEQAREVSALLCAKINEISEAVGQLKEENSALKYKVQEEERKMVGMRAEMVPEEEDSVCIFTEDLEGDSMRMLVNLVLEKNHRLCAVFQGNEKDGYRYVMGSRTVDMKSLVREFNAAFEGRGGGRPEMVQGTAAGTPEKIRLWLSEKAEEKQ